QFTEIVAGDVLDNVAAGFDLPAVGKKSAQAKHEAARLAVSKALCAAHASGHDAAHARAPVVRRVEWQPLTGATRCLIERSEVHARFDCGDQIGRFMPD